MKADLHLHSKSSKRASQWVLQKIGCPECFSEPESLYSHAMKSGMDAFTLTDHNTIEGALSIAHLPHTFISEESTSYFPDNGCKVHVLCWDITEGQHDEIYRLRENVFDLVEYLNREKIRHAAAHPLYSINGRLTQAHFEQILLLFKTLEINGAHGRFMNETLRAVISLLDKNVIEKMADRHGIDPVGPRPWEKNLTGGSDDHSGLHATQSYTEVPGAKSLPEFFMGIAGGRSKAVGAGARAETLAHNLYGIAYQYYTRRFDLSDRVKSDVLFQYLSRMLAGTGRKFPSVPLCFTGLRGVRNGEADTASIPFSSIRESFLAQTRKLVLNDSGMMDYMMSEADSPDEKEARWFDFVNKSANRIMADFADHIIGQLSGADLFTVFQSLGSAAALYTLLSPYFVSYSVFSGDRKLAGNFLGNITRDATGVDRQRERVRLAHFTDTFYEINGVALTLRQSLQTALAADKFMRIITCDHTARMRPEGVVNFSPTGGHSLPEYPEQPISYPPFLEMLRFCHENNISVIHSATPGPIGLAALGVSRILKLPIVSTYHTSLPQYAGILTKDPGVEDAAWKFVLWYYKQMDLIFVSSRANLTELKEKGIPERKLVLFPRGIDTERFHPPGRNGSEGERADRPFRLLYVGRVSREKNMDVLERAFAELISGGTDLELLVVGDGPYLDGMKENLKGLPAIFTGYLEGEVLCEAYRRSDLFVFPSATDTFGNVVLESQASGLPVIVTDQGGPKENMIPGKTGLTVPAGNPEALAGAIANLAASPDVLRQMGENARKYMEDRSFKKAFLETWTIYQRLTADPDEDPAKLAEEVWRGRLVA